jgi:hypothetical protein
MSWSMHRVRAVLAALLVALSAALVVAAPASAIYRQYPEMTGDQVVPGPGDAEASGSAVMTIDAVERSLCISWDIVGMDPAVAAHIHTGAAGEDGPIVVTLPTPAADGTGSDCLFGLDQALLFEIVGDWGNYYVDVHTASFPNGAIRGQVRKPIESITLSFMTVACQEGQSIDLADEPFWSGCSPVFLPGDDPGDPPAGYRYLVEPIVSEYEVVITAGNNVFTTADSSRSGDPTCDTVTFVCIATAAYEVDSELSGSIFVHQTVVPGGYEWRSAYEQFGDVAPQRLYFSAGSLQIEYSAINSTFLLLVDEPKAAVPTPSPPPAPTPTPTAASAEPSAAALPTVPPTSTLSVLEATGGAIVVPMVVLALMALASLLAVLRGMPRRR